MDSDSGILNYIFLTTATLVLIGSLILSILSFLQKQISVEFLQNLISVFASGYAIYVKGNQIIATASINHVTFANENSANLKITNELVNANGMYPYDNYIRFNIRFFNAGLKDGILVINNFYLRLIDYRYSKEEEITKTFITYLTENYTIKIYDELEGWVEIDVKII